MADSLSPAPLSAEQINSWAHVLNDARTKALPISQISQQLSPFPRGGAYAIQEKQLQMRLDQGEKQIGWKMGLTSEAKRRQMNLDSPLYGFLTDKMQVPNEGRFSLKGRIHPKIEPEVAFLIAKDLSGKVSREQVLESCSAVAAALEILDSRYQQFKYFSMEDVIADNSSSSDFVMGPWRKDFQDLDLKELPLRMFADGALAQEGVSKDISGDPVLSVVQLCELLAERGQVLTAGSLVLAGAATTAIELKPGLKVKLEVAGLDPVFVEVEGH